MIFRPFYYFDRGCAAYLFGCGTLSRRVVVDAWADDVDTYVAFAASKNMRITRIDDMRAGLSGKPVSTIAFERRWNPMLSRDKESFVDALADVPPKPADMDRMLTFNRGHHQVDTNA